MKLYRSDFDFEACLKSFFNVPATERRELRQTTEFDVEFGKSTVGRLSWNSGPRSAKALLHPAADRSLTHRKYSLV